MLCELCGEQVLRRFGIVGAVLAELDDPCGVDEVKAEILGENDAVEVFAAACRKVPPCVVFYGVFDALKLIGKVKLKTETLDNAVISFGYDGKNFVNRLFPLGQLKALVKEVGDFYVKA